MRENRIGRGKAASSPALWREVAGVVAAVSVAFAVTTVVLSTTKASLILYDGDSQLPLLWRASVWSGAPQHWILTSPLFLVEMLLYGPASLLPLPNTVTLALLSIISWSALYLAGRFLASSLSVRGSRAVAASLGVVGIPALAAMLERSPDRNALEPAALLSTATYYSGSVIATLLLLGLAIRAAPGTRARSTSVVLSFALTVFASMSNPLFIAWTVGPLAFIMVVVWFTKRHQMGWLIGSATLVAAAGVGMLGRIPFSSILVQDNGAKVRPDLAADSLSYYANLLHDRVTRSGGIAEVPLVVIALAAAVAALIIGLRRKSPGPIVVASFAIVSPLMVAVMSVLVGTFAARYLQPIVFFPPLAVVALVALWPPLVVPPARGMSATLHAAIACAVIPATIVAGAALSCPIVKTDPSIACAVRWVDRRGAPGAGQYWSVRAVKASVRDPRLLVQTDDQLNGYSWLTNDDDFSTRKVYFTITDSESPPFVVGRTPRSTIKCGRYTIDDYGSDALEVGAAHH